MQLSGVAVARPVLEQSHEDGEDSMYYVSTRDHSLQYTPAQAIAQGLSRDGGLFLPVSIPKLPEGALKKMTGMTYQQRAAYIMGKFLSDFTAEELATLFDILKNIDEENAEESAEEICEE